MPNVSSCYAMANLLRQSRIISIMNIRLMSVPAPVRIIGVAALEPVRRSMGDPLEPRLLHFPVARTTGVTIKPWTGIFMLQSSSPGDPLSGSVSVYRALREVVKDNGKRKLSKEVLWFDFALDRAPRQISSDYSCRLNVAESNPEKKVGDFISFYLFLRTAVPCVRSMRLKFWISLWRNLCDTLLAALGECIASLMLTMTRLLV